MKRKPEKPEKPETAPGNVERNRVIGLHFSGQYHESEVPPMPQPKPPTTDLVIRRLSPEERRERREQESEKRRRNAEAYRTCRKCGLRLYTESCPECDR